MESSHVLAPSQHADIEVPVMALSELIHVGLLDGDEPQPVATFLPPPLSPSPAPASPPSLLALLTWDTPPCLVASPSYAPPALPALQASFPLLPPLSSSGGSTPTGSPAVATPPPFFGGLPAVVPMDPLLCFGGPHTFMAPPPYFCGPHGPMAPSPYFCGPHGPMAPSPYFCGPHDSMAPPPYFCGPCAPMAPLPCSSSLPVPMAPPFFGGPLVPIAPPLVSMAVPPPSAKALGKRRMRDENESPDGATFPLLAPTVPPPTAKAQRKRRRLDDTVEPAQKPSFASRQRAAGAGPSQGQEKKAKSAKPAAPPATTAKKQRCTYVHDGYPPAVRVAGLDRCACPIDGCAEEFSPDKGSANAHLRARHPSEGTKGESVSCPCRNEDGKACKRTAQYSNLGRHILDSHIAAKMWKCPLCDEQPMARKTSAERHIRGHFKVPK